MNRFTHRLGVVLGILGTILCAVALVAVWVYYPLGKEKTEEIYTRVDETLEQVGDRIEVTRQRTVVINTMTADFRTSLTQWLNDRQVDQEHVGHRAEVIAAHLHQARDGLEFASSFLQKVRSAQRLAHPFKKQTETQELDGLLEELAKVREHVSDVVDSVDEIRRQAEESGDTEKLEATIEQSIDKIVKVMEIIDTADNRLETLSSQVSEAQLKAEKLEARILRDLWWGRLGTSIILPWMALGQIALCIVARRSSPEEEQVGESGLTNH